jgi:hypothetical protein
MGTLDFFRKRPGDQVVVFAGDRVEAGLVMRMLEEEGFHPREWADMPGPYIGQVGMSRLVVPPDEGEAARQFLAALEAGGTRGEGEGDPEQL